MRYAKTLSFLEVLVRIVLSLVLGVLLFTALAGCGRLNFRNAAVSESEEQRLSRQSTEQANALDSRLGVETKNLSLVDRVSALENASGLFIHWDGNTREQVDALCDFYDVKDAPTVVRVDELGKKMNVTFEPGDGFATRLRSLKDAYHRQPDSLRLQVQLARVDKYLTRVERLEGVLSIRPEKKEIEPRLQLLEKEFLRADEPRPTGFRERLAKLEAAAGM